jgi:hypothetical protein
MKKLFFILIISICSIAHSAESSKINIVNTAYSPVGWGCNTNGLSTAIDASGEKFAFGFHSSDSFTLSKVAFRVHSITGTPVAYDVRIETDSSGRPSGTLAWTNATGQLAAGTSTGIKEVTLTATGTINIGTRYHVVIQPNTDPASNYINIAGSNCGKGFFSMNGAFYNGSSWSGANDARDFALISNDGTPLMISAWSDQGAPYLNNLTWKGLKVTMSDTVTMIGACLEFDSGIADSTGTLSVHVIDTSNNILESGSITANNIGLPCVYLDAPYELVKDTTYRIVWQDSSGALRYRSLFYDSSYVSGDPRRDYQNTYGTSSDGTASPTSWTDASGKYDPPMYIISSNSVCSGGGGETSYGCIN